MTSLLVALLKPSPRRPLISWTCVAVSAYCLICCVPIPLRWLEVVAPANAEVWRETLLATTGRAPEWARLSIDPGASLREALKWICYALLTLLAASIAEKGGFRRVATAVFSATTAVALVTLAHGIFGAGKVYGLYERSFRDGQWALSPIVNNNNLAGYLNLGFFVGAGLLLLARTHRMRTLVAGSMTLLAALALTSGSRGATGAWILGILATGIVIAVRSRRTRVRLSRGSVALLMFLPFVIFGLVLLLIPDVALKNLDDKSLDKLSMIRWAVPLIRDHLWFGVGPGAFEAGFLPYRVRDDQVIWTHPENIVLGWVAEMGLPVTVLLFASVGFLFWRKPRSQLDTPRSLALLGIAVWFLQNLVDLAVVVPGVFAAVLVLLTGLVEQSVSRQGDASERTRNKWLAPWIALLGGGSVAALVLAFGMLTADMERRSLHIELERLQVQKGANFEGFFSRLRTAVQRHPGDSYLLQLGARAALSDPTESTLTWLGRAVERDVMNAESHFLLARALFQRGARNQGLLELRLAAERNPQLAVRVAEEATKRTRVEDELLRVVPEGPAGSQVLIALSSQFSRASQPEARLSLLQRAVERSPADAGPRLKLLDELLWHHEKRTPPCHETQASCDSRIRKHFLEFSDTIVLSKEQDDELLLHRAKWLAQIGDPAGAVALLLSDCSRVDHKCLGKAVVIAGQAKLPAEEPALHYLAVACVSEATCAEAHRKVAAAHEKGSAWSFALKHHVEAALLSGSANDYLNAANCAYKLGDNAQVRRLLRKLEDSSPPPTPANRKRARKLEALISR